MWTGQTRRTGFQSPARGREQPHGGAVPQTVDVLIAGCGPAWLCLAAPLASFPEITTMIVAPQNGPLEKGQADCVNVRSVEMFQAISLAGKVKREACLVNQTTFWKPNPANRDHIAPVGTGQDVAGDQSMMPHTMVSQARIHQLFLDVSKKCPSRLEPHQGLRVVDTEVDPSTEDYRVTVMPERVKQDGSPGDTVIGTGTHGSFRNAQLSTGHACRPYRTARGSRRPWPPLP